MNLPTSQFLPSDEEQLPPARRRQRSRRLIPPTSGERSLLLQELAHRLTPSLDYFIFTLVAALVLAAAMLFNQPALYVLAALLAPFLAPAVGLSLAAIVGSVRFFLRSLAAFSIGSLIVFLVGCGAGWISTLIAHTNFSFTLQHAYFGWADFVLLSVGIILTAYLLIRSRKSRPLVTSAALVYELYLPIGVAGFGMVGKIPGLWPDALLVFAVHLAWCALLGTLTLAIMGLRPNTVFGYTLGTTLLIVSIIAAVIISGIGTAVTSEKALPPVPSPLILLTTTSTPSPTDTPVPPVVQIAGSPTLTTTNTLVPTKTPTITFTPNSTPVYAKIKPNEYGGAYIRKEPSFESEAITSLSSEVLVIVIDEYTQADNVIWVKIKTTTENPVEGWIVRELLITATPQAEW